MDADNSWYHSPARVVAATRVHIPAKRSADGLDEDHETSHDAQTESRKVSKQEQKRRRKALKEQKAHTVASISAHAQASNSRVSNVRQHRESSSGEIDRTPVSTSATSSERSPVSGSSKGAETLDVRAGYRSALVGKIIYIEPFSYSICTL